MDSFANYYHVILQSLLLIKNLLVKQVLQHKVRIIKLLVCMQEYNYNIKLLVCIITYIIHRTVQLALLQNLLE